jgi:four helix bundle protein
MGDYRDSAVYQRAFELAIQIFDATKKLPSQEAHGIAAQIQNASRAVCIHLADGYKKKRDRDYLDAKLHDAELANEEVTILLDFLSNYAFISKDEFDELSGRNIEVSEMMRYLIDYPNKF